MQTLTKPPKLSKGDSVGVFTPSFPAHVAFREKYVHGLKELERLGFKVVEGSVTQSQCSEGYRTAPAAERARELMELFANPQIKAVISTIGGNNSASLIDHLDFDLIGANAKIFCGYSDLTSLHMAINKYAGLSTFYGPAVMPSFGEFPHIPEYSRDSFLRAVGVLPMLNGALEMPVEWSNHIRDIPTGAWKNEARQLQKQPGWIVTQPGVAEGPLLIANLNTLLSLAGTAHFPDLSGKIIVLEEMEASMSAQERRWTQLRQMGALSGVKALLVGKPEVLKTEGAPFSYAELIEDVLQGLDFPRVHGFDCGHTVPMLTLAQGTRARVEASAGAPARIQILEPMVRG